MNKNKQSIIILSLAFTTLLLVTTAATISQAYGSTIGLSGFSIVPTQAPKGSSVSGSITISNLGPGGVSAVVTFYDGGAAVADNSANPTFVPPGQSRTVQLSFNTVAVAPHCYSASATPGTATIGYCEPGGHILGGLNSSVGSLTLIASTIALAAATTTGLLWAALRRRRTI